MSIIKSFEDDIKKNFEYELALTRYHFSMHLECAKHQSQPYTTALNQLMLKLILQTLVTLRYATINLLMGEINASFM